MERTVKRPKQWELGLFPGLSRAQLQKELDSYQHQHSPWGQILEYPVGAVLVEGGKTGAAKEVTPLCNLISFRSVWALSLSLSPPSGDKEGHWGHYFYHSGQWISPHRHPDDPPKQNQFRSIPDTEAIAQAFPGTDPALLEEYFREDANIRASWAQWAGYMSRRHRQKNWQPPEQPPVHRIRPEDRCLSNDWRLVFDLAAYLGFPIEDLGILL
ncbi:hypothetical protein D1641_03730 [Colidextribacter sp. OB.20]|uniref:hypothetical protein n=1 Tax=Colidextribacter sp. OB.20 TaxID=2304568 RepID=UPI0013682198|nr:hypothetical protein [Colidextribacter sp. OB.20]NBI09133.1 hypothetical protein [Colidextribacter sp. OB.20]